MDPPTAGRKRSRFDAAPDAGPSLTSALPQDAVARATAAAAQAASSIAAAQAASSIAAAQQAALLRAQQLLGSFGVTPSFLPSGIAPAEEANRAKRTVLPPPLVLDAQGRAVDGVDQLMSIPVVPVTTLKINASTRVVPAADRKRAAADAASGSGGAGRPSNKYLAAPEEGDAAAAAAAEAAERRQFRASRALKFVESGKYAAEAEEMRARAAQTAAIAAFRKKGSRLRPQFHAEFGGDGDASGVAGGDDAAEPASAAVAPLPTVPGVAPRLRAPPPDVEWWDAAFMAPADRKAYALRHSAAGAKKAAAAAAAEAAASAAADDTPVAEPTGAVAAAPPVAVPPLSYAQVALSHAKTWQYVEHPEPIYATLEASAAPIVVPLMLTPLELKRRRRAERAARFKERQDQIRLGLLPPEEPKVKLANLYRVLKDSAVADPSAIEAKVRAQAAARLKAHEMSNLARKLTPAERRDKWKRKMTEGTGVASGTDAALFRVSDLGSKQARYKIDVNAQQSYLTGVVLLCRPARANLVYVEGGVRAVRKYVRLMAQRIDWVRAAADGSAGDDGAGGDGHGADDDDDDDDPDASGDPESHPAVTPKGCGSGPGSICEVVWHGHVPKRHFTEFRFEEVRNVAAARRLLEAKGLAHLWDQVYHSARLAAGDDPGSVNAVSSAALGATGMGGAVPAAAPAADAAGGDEGGDSAAAAGAGAMQE